MSWNVPRWHHAVRRAWSEVWCARSLVSLIYIDNDVFCVVRRHQYMPLSHQDLDQTSLNSSTAAVYVIYLLLFINNIVCHLGLSRARYARVTLYFWLVAASYRVRLEKYTPIKSIISQNWRLIFKSNSFVDKTNTNMPNRTPRQETQL